MSEEVKATGIAGLGTWELVGTLEGCPIYKSFDYDTTRVLWVAKMAIDCDGSGGNPHHDPYYQPDTSLHGPDGKALNAEKVPFIVVPPTVIQCVAPVVMGCQAMVFHQGQGLSTPAVVGDQGPSSKIGEASCECARRVGLDGNPNYGGIDKHMIGYVIWPGIAALVDGVQYKLKHS